MLYIPEMQEIINWIDQKIGLNDKYKEIPCWIKDKVEYYGRDMVVIGLGIAVIVTFVGWEVFKGHQSTSMKHAELIQPVQASSSPKVATSKIKVDVGGAVQRPGVVLLDEGARIDDALEAVGGLNEQADKDYLQQALNLAQKITDGDKIFIPSLAQLHSQAPINSPTGIVSYSDNSVYHASIAPTTSPKAAASSGTKTSTNSTGSSKPSVPTGPISINTASLSELDTLPGIGPVYAQKIIDGRPYTNPNELCTKKVVRSDTCTKIQAHISL